VRGNFAKTQRRLHGQNDQEASGSDTDGFANPAHLTRRVVTEDDLPISSRHGY
jgi:hypothetical protein